MRRNHFLSFLVTTAFLCLQPHSVSADDHDQNEKDKNGEQAGHHGKKKRAQAVAQRHAPAQQVPTTKAGKARVQTSGGDTSNPTEIRHAAEFSRQNENVSLQRSERRQYQGNQTLGFAIQGDRSNHYGGRWIESDRHRDWDTGRDHRWNNHSYRYYDGGWLIIDAAPSTGYYRGGGPSLGRSVQERLTGQGYYHGPVDGDIGPGSRHAIANYQADYGLRVSGRIDDALLASLGLR